MTLDAKLVLFSTNVTQAYTIASGLANVVNNGVTVGGKSAVTATDATGTNWVVVPDLDQIGQSIPYAELVAGFYFTAGTATGTGSLTFTPTIAFSDDASTVKSSRVGSGIVVTVTSGVLIPTYAQIPLGWTSNHKYVRINWTIGLSVITSPSITNFTIGLENEPDSGIGRVGNNAA